MNILRENRGFLHLGLWFVIAILAGLLRLGVRMWQASPLIQQIGSLVEEGREKVAESDANPKSKSSAVLQKSTTIRPKDYYIDAIPALRQRQRGK